jgi:indolepyruvate ferredoxin oxidoreductase
MNTQAFQAGRQVVADPTWAPGLRKRRLGAVDTAPVLTAEARALVDRVGASGELRRVLEIRVPELVAYQSPAYAAEYVDFVTKVANTERATIPGETALAEGVARHLFKLMAYKDEYEVARLHLRNDLAAQLAEEYPGGVQIRYALHPPILRAMGFKKKITLGRWFDSAFRLLVGMRGLRGTLLDPFGHAEVRRVERKLIGEYRGLVDKALAELSPETHGRAVKLASLPDLIRGYESIKLRNVQRFREEVRALGF